MLVLFFIIIVLIAVNIVISRTDPKPSARFLKIVEELNKNQESETGRDSVFFSFDPNTVTAEKLDSFALPPNIKRNMLSYREAGGVFRKPEDVRKIYGMNDSIFSEIEDYVNITVTADKADINYKPQIESKERIYKVFNPNYVDRNDLLAMGFNSYQTGNLIRYRESGGKFLKPEDLLKIYGIDTALFYSVVQYIEISEENISDRAVRDLSKIAKIEINMADSSGLVMLHGIGPVFASRILKYRNLLGGFHNKRQLLEVYGINNELFSDISDMIETDTSLIKKIRINFADYSELIRHPYIEKEHASAILNYRQKNGPYKTEEQLVVYGLTDTAAFKRIRPYITCR